MLTCCFISVAVGGDVRSREDTRRHEQKPVKYGGAEEAQTPAGEDRLTGGWTD